MTLAEVLAARRQQADDDHGSPVVGAARLLAAAAFGATIFQAAQSLQVPAYSPSLVGWWAAGAMLYAYAVIGMAPLALAIAVGTIWFVWQVVDAAQSSARFVVSVLLGAVVATAVATVHVPQRVPGPAGGRGLMAAEPWRGRFAEVWRLAAALLALLGLFVAALPIFSDERLRVDALLVVALVVIAAALVAAVYLAGASDRIELVAVVAVLAVAGLLVLWRPEGDIADPTRALTARAVLGVLAYLVAAGWYALLGVRRELPGLTWIATASLVVFTTVQSFAVFAPVISGATLFLAVGLMLIAAGYLVDRGRRHLVRLGQQPDQNRTDGTDEQGWQVGREDSMTALRSRPARVALVVLVQLALLVAAVFGQLSARVAGAEFLVRVAPLDPIDPFRGAYVDLDYPDLDLSGAPARGERDSGAVYLPLVRSGDIWVGGTPVNTRPDGPALRCADKGWRLTCGIESYFLPQDQARAVEEAVRSGTALARLRVDSAGHAAIVDLLVATS